jgi:hypothetical protein
MILADFVRTLPKTWATAPIYAAGVTLPNGKIACGKSPLGRASKENLSPECTANYITDSPETFQAVGVYSGTRSGGLVIFDVDRNLGAIEEKWGADLEKAPCVRSTKKNAAKFLFVVPEEDRLKVACLSHAAAGQEGWEVLWGAQGVLCGAYKDQGEYTFEGDVNALPEAPEWLLERMREQYRKVHQKDTGRKLRDTRFANRSREEKIAIGRSCLSVIEPRGAFSERFWWEIGAMLNSELPNQDGLKLWEEWSQRDNEYSHEWESGKNPCADRWASGFQSRGLGFGSLIKLADLADPDRKRFQRDGIAQLVEEIDSSPVKFVQAFLSGEELLARAEELEKTIENPALLDQAKTALALEGGRSKEGAAAIDRLLDSHLTFKRNNEYKAKDLSELDETPFDYIIPGIIPKPWLLLVHADGGTGKSVMCQTLCKHISQGLSFEVYGALVNVKKGRCLWLNGDQSERIVRRQFESIGVKSGVSVVGEWDMQWYRRFCKLQGGGVDENGNYAPGKYDLIVIDSLDGCNDSNPYEENRREYALPLKRLARRNSTDFGSCTIIVIHHNNRNGGFRGTSAIKAAVDETWNMQKIAADQTAEMGIPVSSRLITVEKSRDDREGHQMVFSLMADFSYKISEVPVLETSVKFPTANQLLKDVLEMMRSTRRETCLKDLVDHQSLGGEHKRRALEHILKKLSDLQLIEACDAPKYLPKKKGRSPKYYRALGEDAPVPFSKRSNARGVSEITLGKQDIPLPGTVLKHTEPSEKEVHRKKAEKAILISDKQVFRNPDGLKNSSSAGEEAFTDNSQLPKGNDSWDAWD